MKITAFLIAILGAFCLSASAEPFGSYGDVSVVSPGIGSDAEAFQLTSTPDGSDYGYAGLYWTAPAGTTLDDITTLSAIYQMTVGTFNGGAPRFSIIDTTNNTYNEAYVYWGTPQTNGTFTDPAAGSPGNTGNYADPSSSDLRVEVNGFGGTETGYTYLTWSQFLALDGNVDVGYVSLDLDGGWSEPDTGQQMLVNDFTVNGDELLAPEPGTFVLLGAGIGLIALARKRSASAQG